MSPRIASNSRSSYLSLQSIGMTGMCPHTQQTLKLFILLLMTFLAWATKRLSTLTGAKTITISLLRRTCWQKSQAKDLESEETWMSIKDANLSFRGAILFKDWVPSEINTHCLQVAFAIWWRLGYPWAWLPVANLSLSPFKCKLPLCMGTLSQAAQYPWVTAALGWQKLKVRKLWA